MNIVHRIIGHRLCIMEIQADESSTDSKSLGDIMNT